MSVLQKILVLKVCYKVLEIFGENYRNLLPKEKNLVLRLHNSCSIHAWMQDMENNKEKSNIMLKYETYKEWNWQSKSSTNFK